MMVVTATLIVAVAGTFAVAGSATADFVCRDDNGVPVGVQARRSEVVELPGRWFVITRGAERPAVLRDCEVMP